MYVCDIYRFEGGGHLGHDKVGIEGFPTLVDMSDKFTMQITLSWFDNLLAALDCYTWVFGKSLLSPGELFPSKLVYNLYLIYSLNVFLNYSISLIYVLGFQFKTCHKLLNGFKFINKVKLK
jgi:hypothetical protein